jgi:hypothetical protein
MSNESIDPADTVSYDDVRDNVARDRDGVESLHDAEAEAGDEDQLVDDFDLDSAEAREVGVDLDPIDGETPRLD